MLFYTWALKKGSECSLLLLRLEQEQLVHTKSVYDNENTKWVASFQSESVKGCCGIHVYVD